MSARKRSVAVKLEVETSSLEMRPEPERGRRRFRVAVARPWVAACVCLILAAHLLWPVLRTPFAGDDIQGSQIRAHVETTGEGLLDVIQRVNGTWAAAEGRFFPVAVVEGVLLHWATPDRDVYKALQVAVPLVLILLAGLFVALLTRDRWTGVLTMAVLVPLHQLRRWHDPLTQFSLQQPSVAAKIILSLALIVLAMRASSTRRFVISVGAAAALWVLAVLNYEITYPLTIVPLALILAERNVRRSRKWASLLLITVPTLVLLTHVIQLRADAPPVKSPAYTTRLDAAEVVPALGKQLSGTLPLSYPVLSGGDVPAASDALNAAGSRTLGAGVALAVVFYLAARRSKIMDLRTALTLTGIGLAWLCLPAMVVSTSVRWQEELDWGAAYIPVYQQGLGLAILATGALGLVRATTPFARWTRGATAVLLAAAAVVGLTLPPTRVISDWVADGWRGMRHSRDVFDAAGRDGFFDVLAGKTVLSPHADGVYWFNGSYVEWLGGPGRVPFANVVEPGAFRCGKRVCDQEGREIWYLTDWSNSEGLYVLWTAPLAGVEGDGTNAARLVVDLSNAQARPHLDGDDIDHSPPVTVHGVPLGLQDEVVFRGRATAAATRFGTDGLARVPVETVFYSLAGPGRHA